MQYYLIFFLIFSCFLNSEFVYSQQIEIHGVVYDSISKQKLENALITVYTQIDSIPFKSTITDKEGEFNLSNLPSESINVSVSYLGLDSKTFKFDKHINDTIIDLQSILLSINGLDLSEVTIYGERDAIFYYGDTIVFKVDSFNLDQNNVVEDLLKLLPGTSVNSKGAVFFNGVLVDRIYIDGEEFFGSDYTIATNYLKADALSQVELSTIKNDKTDLDNNKDELQIINLKLKEDSKHGVIGQTSLASNLQNIHSSDGMISKFKNTQKISIFALAGNSPKNHNDGYDFTTYGMSVNSMGISNNRSDLFESGIPKTLKTGFHFSDYLSSKFKITANYSYSKLETSNDSKILTHYYLPDTTYITSEIINNNKTNNSNELQLNSLFIINSLSELSLNIRYNVQNSDHKTFDEYTYFDELGATSKMSISKNENEGNGENILCGLKFRHRFRKPEREFSLSYNVFYKSATSYYKVDYLSEITDSIPSNEYFNQSTESQNSFNWYKFSLVYIEPISSKSTIEISYDFYKNIDLQIKTTFDELFGGLQTFNSLLSNEFENTIQTNQIDISYKYKMQRKSLTIGTILKNNLVHNHNIESNANLQQNINYILPFARIRFKLNANKNLTLRYTSNSRDPDIFMLQPVFNNSNPNYVLLGNPDLVSTFAQKFSMIYSDFKALTNKNISIGADFNAISNDFATSSLYLEGKTITKPINVHRNFSANAFINYSFPLSKTLKVNPSFKYNVHRNSNIVNNEKIKILNNSYYMNLNIKYESDKIETDIVGGWKYFNSEFQSSKNEESKYSETTLNYFISYEIISYLKLSSNISYKICQSGNSLIDPKILQWNFNLNWSTLKNKNLTFSIALYDILNQNKGINRDVFNNFISETHTTVYGRFGLGKVTFRFHQNKK